jgi:hypothetical protein
MQTMPASLRIFLPPQKRKTSGIAAATIAYASLQLAFKFIWPSAHEHSQTLWQLLGEVVFQTILFAIFFTFLRFALPRNKRNVRPGVNESQPIFETAANPVFDASLQLREDSVAEYEPASQELVGATVKSGS